LISSLLICLLTACSPVKDQITNQYRLSAYSILKSHDYIRQTIFVSHPESVAGYDTNEMLYIKKQFEVNSFVHNAWTDPPADMLFPLILQSLQESHLFFAVASSPHVESAYYRLDTQVIEFHQNFLTRPSQLDFTVKVVLTHANDNTVIASHIIRKHILCPMDTPYGGVIAANIAAKQFTADLLAFIKSHVKQDSPSK